jgi:hypothetical protein
MRTTTWTKGWFGEPTLKQGVLTYVTAKETATKILARDRAKTDGAPEDTTATILCGGEVSRE